MNTVEAAEQLQTIRTLMERAALYRRALGPTFLWVGILGTAAGLAGAFLRVGEEQVPVFISYWAGVAFLAVVGAVLRVRRQAVVDQEPFWTPPTRRVVSAVMPALVVALGAAALVTALLGSAPKMIAATLPPLWMAMHGIALHAAGHFTLRGIRWLGWGFILSGAVTEGGAAYMALTRADLPTLVQAHLAMGVTFGLGHLFAGLWIQVAERRGTP